MERVVKGVLECDEGKAFLGDCRVDLLYRQPLQRPKPTLKEKAAVPEGSRASQLSTRTDRRGHFLIGLPDGFRVDGKSLSFSAFSPAGHLIGELECKVEQLVNELVIPVKGDRLVAVGPEAYQPIELSQRRVRGKVVDLSGKPVRSGLQVTLLGIRDDTNNSEVPVLVTRTDATGAFGGVVTTDTFAKAEALVAGVSGRLAVTLDSGKIPVDLILLVDLPEEATPAGSDCGCGGNAIPRTPTQGDIESSPETYSTDLGTGGCVNFNIPNRAIEEFSFFSVVRTTEPGIVGFSQEGGIAQPASGSGAVLASLESDAAAAAAAAAAARENAERIAASAAQAVAEIKLCQQVLAAMEAQRGTIEIAIEDSLGQPEAMVKATIAARLLNLAPAVATRIAEMLSSSVSSSEAPIGPSEKASVVRTLYGNALAYAIALFKLAERSAQDSSAAIAAASARAKAAANAAQAAAAALAARRREIAAQEAEQADRERRKAGGRAPLSAANPVDWDETPHFYQAAEIAHGHLLHFKQVWYSDGYSLGDLLYSVPLAPGQKRMISIIDWERRDEASQQESTQVTEDISASLGRDRDLSEVVKGALAESSRGGSRNTTAGVGAGTAGAGNGSYQGFSFGALLGVSGGYGESNSTALQDSTRNISSESLQKLRDRTMQSASAVRGQRSTVIRSVRQGEAVRATTEVIANHNHCHAMTVQYFEVLRHLKLTQELANVQECLLVPLPMTTFDLGKALRWRQELSTYLTRSSLTVGFDAARRVQNNWSDVDYPPQQYADEMVDSITGELLITVIVPPPPFPERPKSRPEDTLEETAKAVSEATNPTAGVLGVLLAVATGGASLVAGAVTDAAIKTTSAAAKGARALADEYYAEQDPQVRYARFHREVAPGVVESFVNLLDFEVKVRGQAPVIIGSVDFTLVSEYQPGIPLAVSVRAQLSGQFKRADIEQVIIKSTVPLPTSFRAIVNSAKLQYRTSSFEHRLMDDAKVNDDIDSPVAVPVFKTPFEFSIEIMGEGKQRGVTLYTPLDKWEQRNPRKEDSRLADELIAHLNDNFEYYHHAIWWTMDPNRRYMLLDGYYAPNANGRSVASVVENRLIGIVGNSLVLPVAPGIHLDPRFRPDKNGDWVDLMVLYQPEQPPPATRISLPTKGVFAEAVMGNCNSCEEIDDSRFWRWEDSPIDEPPTIDTLSTATRRADTGSLQAKDLPASLVSIQNAPSVSDPAGVRVVLDALGKSSFADITGLAGTQANAAAAYQQALDTAYKFGKEASTLAQQAAMLKSLDKSMSTIDKAESSGKIDQAKAKQLRESALEKIVGDAGDESKDPASVQKRLGVIADAVKNESISAEDGRSHSNSVLKGLAGEAEASRSDQAISDVIKQVSLDDAQSVKAQTADGASLEVDRGGGGGGGVLGFLNTLLGAVPGATRPDAKRAIKMIIKFSTRSSVGAWPSLNRLQVAEDLGKIVNNPDAINQGALGLCGPAIFFNTLLRVDPVAVVACAISLFETGTGRIGELLIAPDSDLTSQDYARVVPMMASNVVPQGEWMLMSALQDTSNVFIDYEGTPSADWPNPFGDDGTQTGDVVDWLTRCGLFKSVEDKSGVIVNTVAEAKALMPGGGTYVIMVVNADMLYPSSPIPTVSKPNHYIALRTPVTTVGATTDVRFRYWTWGDPESSKQMSEERFSKLYWGAVVAVRKLATD
jgi:hypothetical protein